MVLPLIMGLARTYAPIIVFPAALVIGLIGYNIENLVATRSKNKAAIAQDSAVEEREERLLNRMTVEDCQRSDAEKIKFRRGVLDRN